MKQWPCERKKKDDEKTQRHGYNLGEVRMKNNTMFGLVEGKRKEWKGRDSHCLVSRVERKFERIEKKREKVSLQTELQELSPNREMSKGKNDTWPTH